MLQSSNTIYKQTNQRNVLFTDYGASLDDALKRYNLYERKLGENISNKTFEETLKLFVQLSATSSNKINENLTDELLSSSNFFNNNLFLINQNNIFSNNDKSINSNQGINLKSSSFNNIPASKQHVKTYTSNFQTSVFENLNTHSCFFQTNKRLSKF